MLIVSRFHDYYDSALGVTGVDKTCVYERKTEEVKRKSSVREWRDEEKPFLCGNRHDDLPRVSTFIVGFCGKIHPGVRILDKDLNRHFFYEEEAALKAMKKFDLLREHRWRGNWYWSDSSKEWVEAFFARKWTYFDGWFREHKVPVFLVDGDFWKDKKTHVLVLNPQLKDLSFMKVADPFTAFQEVHMFLSGVLGSDGNPMVEIGNDDRVKARGFDKMSFRKEPSKKKGRKNG